MSKVEYRRNSYADPKWSVLLGLLAATAAVGLGMRALDTGSWQQYFLTFAAAVYALNRFGHTVIYLIKGKVA